MSEILLDTDDLGEAEAVLAARFARLRLSPPAGAATRFRITQWGSGALAVQELDYGSDFGYVVDPLTNVLICAPRSGGFDQRLPNREAVAAAPGLVAALGVFDDVPFRGDVRAGRFSQLVLGDGMLSEVASSATRSDDPVRLTGLRPISGAANNYFVRVMDYVRDVADRALDGDNPLLAGEIRRHVAATVLATFPSTARFDVTATDRRDGTPQQLRRAMAYIDDHAARDILLADIAAEVAVTPRALQYMFRRHRNSTPLEYLRAVRLQRAHDELTKADAAVTTVGEIARRWGFGHAGRFAAYHRECFGESPYRTLRAGS